MSQLHKKSLVELRGIAQSFGIPDIFQKDAIQLAQAIELKQESLVAPKMPEVPKPEYDARLMTKPPAKRSDEQEAMALLQPYIERGLNVRFDEERWYFSFGIRNDQGTIRMPLRVMLRCAERVLHG